MAPDYPVIWESENFLVEARQEPFVSREEGGHIRIISKIPVPDRTKLPPEAAVELMMLSCAVGAAMEAGLKKRGIPIIKINYCELGNWAFKKGAGKNNLHLHLFGRAKDAKIQKFPEAVQLPPRESGFYDKFVPLNGEDCSAIKSELGLILSGEKFRKENWKLP